MRISLLLLCLSCFANTVFSITIPGGREPGKSYLVVNNTTDYEVEFGIIKKPGMLCTDEGKKFQLRPKQTSKPVGFNSATLPAGCGIKFSKQNSWSKSYTEIDQIDLNLKRDPKDDATVTSVDIIECEYPGRRKTQHAAAISISIPPTPYITFKNETGDPLAISYQVEHPHWFNLPFNLSYAKVVEPGKVFEYSVKPILKGSWRGSILIQSIKPNRDGKYFQVRDNSFLGDSTIPNGQYSDDLQHRKITYIAKAIWRDGEGNVTGISIIRNTYDASKDQFKLSTTTAPGFGQQENSTTDPLKTGPKDFLFSGASCNLFGYSNLDCYKAEFWQ